MHTTLWPYQRMRPPGIVLSLVTLLFIGSWPLCGLQAETYSAVNDLFVSRCVICHNGPAAPNGLRLDAHADILRGSSNGPVVMPGNGAESPLMKRIRGDILPRMPLTGPPYLSDAEMRTVSAWIDAGAPGPAVHAATDDSPDASPPASPPASSPGAPAVTATMPTFEAPLRYRDIAPILLQRCSRCHRANAPDPGPPEGLSVMTHEALLRGGERVVVVPGKPLASELMRRVAGMAQPRMPFDGPPWLSAAEIERLSRWIADGARDNDGRPAPIPVGREVRLHGTLSGSWTLDGLPLQTDDSSRLARAPAPGHYAEVRGHVLSDGSIHADRVRAR